MKELNHETIERLMVQSIDRMVASAFGESGLDALERLMKCVKKIYRHLPFEGLSMKRMIVFIAITSSLSLVGKRGRLVSTYEELAIYVQDTGGICQMIEEDRFLVWDLSESDPLNLSSGAIVYENHDFVEKIYFQNQFVVLPEVYKGGGSVLSSPTYWDLEDALEHYDIRLARRSTCQILKECWYDDRRILFKDSPEKIMRRSLEQFLRSRMQADVRPEQNTDETHPIDLKVSWGTITALIEIKWMGASIKNGHLTRHYPSRAIQGLAQLCNYLNAERTSSPHIVVRGKLIVFDGRRGGIRIRSLKATRPSKYATKEIEFPDDMLRHRDMLSPKRIYMEVFN